MAPGTARQQAMILDDVGQDMKVFLKEFEENFLYKKVFLKVLVFKNSSKSNNHIIIYLLTASN